VRPIDKRSRMLGSCDIAQSLGLEIGALNAPMVRKSEGRVLYVDYASTDIVRANQHDPAVNKAEIVEIDIVWGDRPLAAAVGEPVDYVIASHVIEHVPDLIGWLGELHASLKPGGTLGLAIPDRRFTFDVHRRESLLAEMVEAYLLKFRRPSIRQVFDAASLAQTVDVGAAWAGKYRETSVPPHAVRPEFIAHLPASFTLARSLLEQPRYVDAHCWVFTPASFLDTAQWLAGLQMFPYAIEDFFPTETGWLEFQVRLIAVAPDATACVIEQIEKARHV